MAEREGSEPVSERASDTAPLPRPHAFTRSIRTLYFTEAWNCCGFVKGRNCCKNKLFRKKKKSSVGKIHIYLGWRRKKEKKDFKVFPLFTTVTFLTSGKSTYAWNEYTIWGESQVFGFQSRKCLGRWMASPVLIAELTRARRNVTIIHGRSAGSIYFTLRLILQE